MTNIMLNQEEFQIIQNLKKKFQANPDEFRNALTGFYHQKGVNYWDYLQLEILLNLQQTKTDFDDEMIFIVYHQITELYFKLILHELEKLTCLERKEFLHAENWIKRIGRVVNYCHKVTDSFNIMQPGEAGKPNQFLSKGEFLQFRNALVPASGFQSVALRKIEFYATSLYQLLHPQVLNKYSPLNTIEELYEGLYWKFGGWITESGRRKEKSKTLEAFEKKYDKTLIELAHSLKERNLYFLFFQYQPQNKADQQVLQLITNNQDIRNLLYEFDYEINQRWKTIHFSVISRQMENEEKGTGGTNWKEYLPPQNQQICYFPQLRKK
ncbi:MAG: hypothetical protein GX437_02560 [Sphingobacteriales bacterium]|nr:hypothetical protein [Sphingobacteriales bacterium]